MSGSVRTTEAIRYKINKILESYKIAKERFNNTGAGLEGIAFNKFQDYVYTKICKYYEQLDPVMKNRPNVYPVYTNSSDVEDEEDSIVMSSHSNDNNNDEHTVNVSNTQPFPVVIDLNAEEGASNIRAVNDVTADTSRNLQTQVDNNSSTVKRRTSNLNISTISDITVSDTPTSCEKSNVTRLDQQSQVVVIPVINFCH
jgi:hypothetical protein